MSVDYCTVFILVCPSSSTTPAVTARDSEERYIQYSKVPTLHFQPSLPRLPIPKLSDTCQRYLAALQPVVGPEQHQHTKKIVEEFGKEGGEGEGRREGGEGEGRREGGEGEGRLLNHFSTMGTICRTQ